MASFSFVLNNPPHPYLPTFLLFALLPLPYFSCTQLFFAKELHR